MNRWLAQVKHPGDKKLILCLTTADWTTSACCTHTHTRVHTRTHVHTHRQYIQKAIRRRQAHVATLRSHTSLRFQPSLTGVNRCRIIARTLTPPSLHLPLLPPTIPPYILPPLPSFLTTIYPWPFLHPLIHLHYLHLFFPCSIRPAILTSPLFPLHPPLSFLSISPVCFHHRCGSFLLSGAGL